jgi:hypothetical protein
VKTMALNILAMGVTIWVLLILVGILIPLIALWHLFFKKKAKDMTKLMLFLMIVFVPFGWLIYWLIYKKVR